MSKRMYTILNTDVPDTWTFTYEMLHTAFYIFTEKGCTVLHLTCKKCMTETRA